MTAQPNKPIKPTNHKHKFVIPVEWDNFPARESGVEGGRSWSAYSRVTKLMCECGEAKSLW